MSEFFKRHGKSEYDLSIEEQWQIAQKELGNPEFVKIVMKGLIPAVVLETFRYKDESELASKSELSFTVDLENQNFATIDGLKEYCSKNGIRYPDEATVKHAILIAIRRFLREKKEPSEYFFKQND